jgi:hypothetical protein
MATMLLLFSSHSTLSANSCRLLSSWLFIHSQVSNCVASPAVPNLTNRCNCNAVSVAGAFARLGLQRGHRIAALRQGHAADACAVRLHSYSIIFIIFIFIFNFK